VDRRKFCRVRISAKAKLYTADQAREVDCVVDTLSPGGAGVQCKNPPPAKAHVALYINGFGRFEGVTTRPTKDGIGIRFICTPRKRQKIVEQLTLFVKDGLTAGISHLRYFSQGSLEISEREHSPPGEIQVTAEMLTAGEAEALAWEEAANLAPHVLMAIYIAMARAQSNENEAQKQLRRNVVKRRAGG
jgi:hypothetical protein